MGKVSFILSAAMLTISLFLVGCGEEEQQQPDPREIIDGTWTGSLISETTSKEKPFEAILCCGEDPDILPPYYYDLFGISIISKITNVNYTPVGVNGVFTIRSDDRVDTLRANGPFCSPFKDLYLRLYVDGHSFYCIKYELRGSITNRMVEGSYEEFGLENGHRSQVDAGTWSGIRTVEQKPTTQHKEGG